MNIQKLMNWIKNRFGSKYVDWTGTKISQSFHIHKMPTPKQLTNYIALIQEKYNVYCYLKGKGDGSVMLRIEEKVVRVGDDNGK